MSWNTLPADVQTAATHALTDKQLGTFKLELAGLSARAISKHLGIARTTVNDRLYAVHAALIRAGISQDEYGHWHLRNGKENAA